MPCRSDLQLTLTGVRFTGVPGVQVVPIGEAWAGFSPLTADTLILNNESAAILEVLALGECSLEQLAAELSTDCDAIADSLLPVLASHCQQLAEAGFIRSCECSADH